MVIRVVLYTSLGSKTLGSLLLPPAINKKPKAIKTAPPIIHNLLPLSKSGTLLAGISLVVVVVSFFDFMSVYQILREQNKGLYAFKVCDLWVFLVG